MVTTRTPQLAEITCLAANTASGQARRLIEFRFADWGLGAARNGTLRDDVSLATAELVANAVRADPDGRIWIRLTRQPGSVIVGVWDSSDELPRDRRVEFTLVTLDLNPERFDDNGGWGLPLVMELASETGVERTPPRGKWVWASFEL